MHVHPDYENDRIIPSSSFPDAVHLGRGTYFSPAATFTTYIAEERIHIGRYCSIAENAVIASGGEHVPELVTTYPMENNLLGRPNPGRSYKIKQPTRVGSDVWICRGANIFGGAAVGNGAIIGAGAMVAKDVPPYAIVIGNPARILRYRFPEAVCEALSTIAWWDWTPQEVKDRVEWFYRPVEEFVTEFGRKS